eukprot:TRINITY_DN1627_c0_g1_i11.p1 TRINITY_DN1627_c0_g1~~TRINITY_DN1627_c0_g1_i11.p1  ORF type:complete len:145 (-),score=38.95 TRINITY_DN1627_c0_g1_i11:76-510(-)
MSSSDGTHTADGLQQALVLLNDGQSTSLICNMPSNKQHTTSSGNHIGAEGAKSLAEAIKNNTTITSLQLYLYSNHIGDEGAKSLAEAIKNNMKEQSHLPKRSRDLFGNDIGDEGAKSLAEAIKNNTTRRSKVTCRSDQEQHNYN